MHCTLLLTLFNLTLLAKAEGIAITKESGVFTALGIMSYLDGMLMIWKNMSLQSVFISLHFPFQCYLNKTFLLHSENHCKENPKILKRILKRIINSNDYDDNDDDYKSTNDYIDNNNDKNNNDDDDDDNK